MSLDASSATLAAASSLLDCPATVSARALVAAGLAVELVFDGLGLIPAERKAKVLNASVILDYTTYLNVVF